MIRWFRLFGWAILFFPYPIYLFSEEPSSPLENGFIFKGDEVRSLKPAATREIKDLTLLLSDERGVTIRYSPAKPTFQIKKTEEGTFYDLFVSRTTTLSPEAGSPVIPTRLVHIGIPLDAKIRVEVQNLRSSSRSLDHPISPYPLPEGSYKINEEIYSREGLYPGKWVSDPEIGFIRNQRVLSLWISPIQYNPNEKSLQVLEEIEIRVNFLGGVAVGAGLKPAQSDPFEGVYERVLINYEDSKGWRRERTPPSPATLSSNPWVKITLQDEGIYHITYNDLQSLGVPVNFIDPRTFQLFNGGSDTLPQSLAVPRPDSVEVSLYIRGEEDNSFDPEDEIYFFGAPLTGWRFESDTLRFHRNPYTDLNVYWLTWSEGGMGMRMGVLDGSPSDPNPIRPDRYEEKIRFEEEMENPSKSGLSWIWKILNRPADQSSVSFSFPFTLSDLASSNGVLRFILYGRSVNQHNVRVRLNGAQVADLSWSGCDCSGGGKNYPRILSDSVSQFQEGVNTIQIEEYRTGIVVSEVFFDFAEAEVERRFVAGGGNLTFTSPDTSGRTEFTLSGFSEEPLLLDITDLTDPFRPRRIVNGSFQSGSHKFQDLLSSRKRYIASFNFKEPLRMVMDSPVDLKIGGADYIALCPDDFYDAVLPLIEWRRDHLEGFSNPDIERVRVSDIYDNFSWGVIDPTAIRDFLKHAFENWSPQPSYCLFAGAGSYDYKNNLGFSPPKNFLPPYQEGGLIVTNSKFPQDLNDGYDEWFAIFDTFANADPQLRLGRITVKTPQETRRVVEKIIDYERNRAFGPWRNRVLLAADDAYSVAGEYAPDNEYGFTTQCEDVVNNHTEPEMDAVKVYMVNYFEGPPLSEMPKARQALIRGMDEGFLAGLYLGHGNIEQLAHEKLFIKDPYVDALKNGVKTFFMYFGSCSVGQFDRPEKEDMASSFQKKKDGGGIATFAATRSSFYGSNGTLANTLFENLFKTPLKTIGDVIITTRIEEGRVHNIYNLFGDPASTWSPPELDVVLTLSDSSLIGLSKVTIHGTVEDPFFNGFASLNVFDSAIPESDTFTPNGTDVVIDYILPGTSIYRGVTPVTGGKFTQSFFVPEPSGIQTGNLGRISAYVWDGERDGHGALDSLFVGGTVPLLDTIPPTMTLYHGGRVLTPSDTLTVPLSPRLTLLLEDESGIYLGNRRTDKRLLLIQDGNEGNPVFLNHLFQYDEGSGFQGSVQVDLQFKDPLRDTTHTLEFRASDNTLGPDNDTSYTVVVKVIPSHQLSLYRVMNYPNPVRNHRTQFVFELVEENIEVEIKIYTVSGRILKVLRVPGRAGLNRVEWDCRDEKGDPIANGVYLYKVRAQTMSQGFSSPTEKVSEVVEKLVVAH